MNSNYKLIKEDLEKYIEIEFTSELLPNLQEFIKIPNISPNFDKDWKTNRLLIQAFNFIRYFAENSGIIGLKTYLRHVEDRTPFLIMTIDTTLEVENKCILIYGHFDKQPPFIGWDKDKGPYKPIINQDYLYGRGASGDGYSLLAALTCIKALQNFKISHPKFILIGDGCEESGSIDLPIYIEENKDLIGQPDMIISLDSGAGDFDRLWITNALRGVIFCRIKKYLVLKKLLNGGMQEFLLIA